MIRKFFNNKQTAANVNKTYSRCSLIGDSLILLDGLRPMLKTVAAPILLSELFAIISL
jgi:hypothetical protein